MVYRNDRLKIIIIKIMDIAHSELNNSDILRCLSIINVAT